MAFIDRIRECAAFDPTNYVAFKIGEADVGLIKPALLSTLAEFPQVFQVRESCVTLSSALSTCDQRTAAVEPVLRTMFDRGLIPGWRNEPYRVADRLGAPPLLLMERAALPLFGIRAAGIHVNGFVRQGSDLSMWVGRRSFDKPTSPGKLDQIVAGGQCAPYSVLETLIKESDEEAGISASLAASARPVGAITYCTEREEGLRRDTIYLFDLELSADFEPKNRDGEISEFFLWPLAEVIRVVAQTRDFKFNCSLVIIDFLIRHGYLPPDHEDYLELIAGLHH